MTDESDKIGRIVDSRHLERGQLRKKYEGNRRLRAERGPRMSAARHELTPWPGEVRCRPRRGRWRPGDPGPCGLYLGDVRNDMSNGWHFVPAGPVSVRDETIVFEGVPAPQKREGRARHDRTAKPTWISLDGREWTVHCPRCGYRAPLHTLTISKVSK